MSHRPRRPRRLLAAAAAVTVSALTLSGFALGSPSSSAATPHDPTGTSCLRAVGGGPVASARQRVFAAASKTYAVPVSVLLGVSYMESRWDDHGSASSTAGGYGPMHLTDVTVEAAGLARGEGPARSSEGPGSLHTASIAAKLTKLDAARLKSDAAANVCGGAAVLSSYQRDLGKVTGSGSSTAAWYDAVKSYSGAATPADAVVFADRVFATIKSGQMRTTNDAQQVQLTAQPALTVPATQQPSVAGQGNAASLIDCPTTISCESIPAPYEQWGAKATDYGNHDIANRETGLTIDYIVIHDTETSYDNTLRLVQDPTYVSWNYTLRSSDGHVAQNLEAKDVGHHSGNWYFNMHSIGLEHEGFAAQGATWYTEAMYATSAQLVAYLAAKYSVKLDRAHIIGHDQVPGIIPSWVRGQHWDPGPYWDWEHYMSLLGAPLVADRVGTSAVVTIKPGFGDNQQPVTGCSGPGPCTPQGTNFVYLHTEPSDTSPLVKDLGLHTDGSYSTTSVSDHGARLAAGQKVVVAQTSGDWLGVWYLGEIGWFYSPATNPDVVLSGGKTVTTKPGALSVPVYGRAYPEPAAYAGTTIPRESVTPLQYTINAGQKYVLADDTIDTNYYYAKTFDNSLPYDHTLVTGQDKYYEIWFGHRMFFVRAADVVVGS